MKTEEQRLLDELYDKEQRWYYSDNSIKIPKEVKYPDPRKHQVVSFIKSGIRIVGYGLILIDPISAVITLIGSEVVGILEELV